MKSGDTLSLSFGLQFDDLYTSEGLAKVDVAFQRFLESGDAALLPQLLAARVDPKSLARKDARRANYCIWCHNQGKDSCSRGLREKAPRGADRQRPFKKSPFGVTLAGCPLEEKISEFHLLKTEGQPDRRARR
jgi:hypothetical protein